MQVSRKEMQATLALRFGGEGILKMKGIPFKATAGDVRKFFFGYRIRPDGISFIMHADGRPTGMVRSCSLPKPPSFFIQNGISGEACR